MSNPWEYLTLNANPDRTWSISGTTEVRTADYVGNENLHPILSALGEEGWELVLGPSGPPTSGTYVFKRQPLGSQIKEAMTEIRDTFVPRRIR